MKNNKIIPVPSSVVAPANLDVTARSFEEELARMQELNNAELQTILGGTKKSDALRPAVDLIASEERQQSGGGHWYGAGEHDDEMEEIVLSHQLPLSSAEADKYADELQEQFLQLSNQVDEYKNRYVETLGRLKDTETKLIETEVTADALETQVAELQKDLKLANSRVLAGGAGHSRSHHHDKNANSPELDAHRRAEQIRKALLEGDDDDINVSMTDVQHGGLFSAIAVWLRHHAPLKEDIRQIQAKFGNAVSAYFHFSRFV